MLHGITAWTPPSCRSSSCTQYAAPVDANGNVTGQYEPFGRPTTATLSGRAQETGQLALTGGKAVEAGSYVDLKSISSKALLQTVVSLTGAPMAPHFGSRVITEIKA